LEFPKGDPKWENYSKRRREPPGMRSIENAVLCGRSVRIHRARKMSERGEAGKSSEANDFRRKVIMAVFGIIVLTHLLVLIIFLNPLAASTE
jgi:hypothetical protein